MPYHSTETEEMEHSTEKRKINKKSQRVGKNLYRSQDAIYINLSPHLIQ